MGSVTTSVPVFQATWNKQNIHLKPPTQTLFKRICRVAWDILSVLIPVILIVRMVGWGVAALSKKATLPAAHVYSPEQIQEIRDIFDEHCFGEITAQNAGLQNNFLIERHTVLTPDGVPLSTVHFKHKNATSKTPTILYFQPNMSMSEMFIQSWLLAEVIKRGVPFNFIVYDSRSVSRSGGVLNDIKELIIDGDAVYQFAIDKLGVPPDLLYMYGWSLGGCISANVKALHPKCTGRYVSERSFSSTRSVVESYIKGIRKLLFWFPCAMEVTKWNFKAPLKKVKGPMMIVHHPNDSTIPYSASAHRAAVLANLNFESIRLSNKSHVMIAQIAGFPIFHHAYPLTEYEVGGRYNRKGADQVIADFFLQSSETKQQSDPCCGKPVLDAKRFEHINCAVVA